LFVEQYEAIIEASCPMTQRLRSYIICGTPRSGSTLLCEMLSATGLAGRPNSYFREQDIARWADQWGVVPPNGPEDADFDRSYLNAMTREGSAGTGVFGLRLMWGSVEEARRRLGRVYASKADVVDLFREAFGPTLFIHLSRVDKVAQAISLIRAEQSGLWHLNADGTVLEGSATPQPVAYNAKRIASLISELRSDEAEWKRFFAERHIEPLRLTYETMAADPRNSLALVLPALGRNPDAARDITIKTAKMGGDQISRDWADRFTRENNVQPALTSTTTANGD
jgi:trehalose 2-sulfotransferase